MTESESESEKTQHTPPVGPVPRPGGAWAAAAAPARVGRYEVRAELGRGACGRVYRAFDPALGREVAVKVPHPDALTPQFRERFLREARATATIHHPNVCPVHDVGTDGEVPYLVLHFVAGSTLAAELAARGGPFDPAAAVDVARRVALGVAAAHAKGVTHRDLKPQNVLWEAATGEVFVTDFGLARVGTAEQTNEGSLLGTPAYMAPEQALGRQAEVGPLSDVYSLGVIFYRLLTGRLPFAGDGLAALCQALVEPPRPPSAARPGLDPALDALCLTAMAREPAARFPSAAAFAAALADYRPPADAPVPPLPSPPPPPLPAGIEYTRGGGSAETIPDPPPLPPPPPARPMPRWLVAPFDRGRARIGQSDWAAYLGVPVERVVPLGEAKAGAISRLLGRAGEPIELRFVLVPPGTFRMGTDAGEDCERPVRQVTITRAFYLAATPVTQAQWAAVMGADGSPSLFRGDHRPVDHASWGQCGAFCRALAERLEPGAAVRLPTEAEWEYACRAGTETEYHTGDGPAALDKAGWSRRTSGGHTHPVGQLAANAWGLFDAHGNVWEWCADWFGGYADRHEEDPRGPAAGAFRVLRGGGWNDPAGLCGSATRNWFEPTATDRRGAPRPGQPPAARNDDIGFRVALEVPPGD